ncbi:ATP-dependent helicase BRM-like protein [Tanacetum coccineum]
MNQTLYISYIFQSSLQVIALILEYKSNYGPHLIIVLNAVLVNWKSELHNWFPNVSCIYYVGSLSHEAQRMKDRESILARDLDKYRCQRRLLLTGTPLQHPVGLYFFAGKMRARDVALDAVQSPLLDIGIKRATGIVWNITGGTNLTLLEVPRLLLKYVSSGEGVEVCASNNRENMRLEWCIDQSNQPLASTWYKKGLLEFMEHKWLVPDFTFA